MFNLLNIAVKEEHMVVIISFLFSKDTGAGA